MHASPWTRYHQTCDWALQHVSLTCAEGTINAIQPGPCTSVLRAALGHRLEQERSGAGVDRAAASSHSASQSQALSETKQQLWETVQAYTSCKGAHRSQSTAINEKGLHWHVGPCSALPHACPTRVEACLLNCLACSPQLMTSAGLPRSTVIAGPFT